MDAGEPMLFGAWDGLEALFGGNVAAFVAAFAPDAVVGACGASDIRAVIGCALTGGRSALSVMSASARAKSGGKPAAVAASSVPLIAFAGAAPCGGKLGGELGGKLGGASSGAFAAGATPHIVFVCLRAFSGRGRAFEALELASFRSSNPRPLLTAAPIQKLK